MTISQSKYIPQSRRRPFLLIFYQCRDTTVA